MNLAIKRIAITVLFIFLFYLIFPTHINAKNATKSVPELSSLPRSQIRNLSGHSLSEFENDRNCVESMSRQRRTARETDECELPSRERVNADILQLTQTTCRAGQVSTVAGRHCQRHHEVPTALEASCCVLPCQSTGRRPPTSSCHTHTHMLGLHSCISSSGVLDHAPQCQITAAVSLTAWMLCS